ncbi:hypothetical protein [Microcoleus sp. B5-D4]
MKPFVPSGRPPEEVVCSLHLQKDLRCCDHHSTLAQGINGSLAF